MTASDALDTPTTLAPTATEIAPPDVVLRKDPERRATTGLGLGLALLAVLASLAPVVVVAAALWPSTRTPSANAPSTSAPVADGAAGSSAVDFAAIRAAVNVRAPSTPTSTSAASTSAASASAASATVSTSASALVFDRERLEKARALTKRVFKARDARRAAGAAGPELRKPFTLVELGGPAAIAEVGLAPGKRLLVSRADGKVVAPVGAAAPDVDLSSKERDEDVQEVDAKLEGKPVHIMRRCLAGELLCLVDIEPRSGSVPTPAPVASTPSEGAPSDRNAALLALLDVEEAKARASSSMPSSSMPSSLSSAGAVTSTLLPPAAGVALGVALALLLGGALASRLVRTGSLVTSAAHRLRALAAGRAGASPGDVPVEVAALHTAIEECAAALGDGGARADADEARRQRLLEVSGALERARERAAARVSGSGADDPSTSAIVAAANALLDSFEARVVRWKSHLDAVATPPRVSSVEARAQALAGIPPLLVDVAQRLLRLARVPELPAKARDELNALGEALASRGRTAQTLVDQLLLDAATDRPGDAPQAALSSLRQELAALSPSAQVHTTVAALRDLPLAELANRVSSSSKP